MTNEQKLLVYVKGVTSKGINCFIVNNDNENVRISARFSVDEAVHNQLISMLSNPLIYVTINNGMIIEVEESGEEVEKDEQLEHFIYTTLNTYNTPIQKSDFYETVKQKYPISSRTIQRTINSMCLMYNDMKQTYTKIWIDKNTEV
jgi:acylphosphatase